MKQNILDQRFCQEKAKTYKSTFYEVSPSIRWYGFRSCSALYSLNDWPPLVQVQGQLFCRSYGRWWWPAPSSSYITLLFGSCISLICNQTFLASTQLYLSSYIAYILTILNNVFIFNFHLLPCSFLPTEVAAA